MKLKFKRQAYQTEAVNAVAECFNGQQPGEMLSYRIDPCKEPEDGQHLDLEQIGFRNAKLTLSKDKILQNIRDIQQRNSSQFSINTSCTNYNISFNIAEALNVVTEL